MTPSTLEELLARAAAQDTVTGVFVETDRCNWAAVAGLLAPSIRLDYTDLAGGEPGDVSREDLVAAWRPPFEGFEATQHLVGSFVFDEVGMTTVRLRFYAIATHVLHEGHGAPHWTVAGHYEATVERTDGGWQLSALAFHPDWGDGNQQLMALATARGGG